LVGTQCKLYGLCCRNLLGIGRDIMHELRSWTVSESIWTKFLPRFKCESRNSSYQCKHGHVRSRIHWHALLRSDDRCLQQRLRGQHLHMSEWHANRCHGDRGDLVRHCWPGGLQRVQSRIHTERSRRCWIGPDMRIVPRTREWDVYSVFVELDMHSSHLQPWVLRHQLWHKHQRLRRWYVQ
jgi:hypothetical protein